MKPSICVLILNYKTYKNTIDYTYSLLKQEGIQLDVLIVDNKSENESFENIRNEFKNYENITVIESEKNGGYAYGNNFGLKYIENKDYDYICITNNDIEISNISQLFNLSELYKNLHKPAFISPIQQNHGKDHSPGWKLPTLTSDLLNNIPFINKFSQKLYGYDIDKNKEFTKVDVIPGSFYFFKKEVIYNLGLLDENTFLYGEERILAYKIKKAGLNSYIINNLTYEHEQSTTISSNLSKLRMITLSHESCNYYHKQYLKTSKFGLAILNLLFKFIQKRLARN